MPVALNASATTMRERDIGITFRETMKGGFSPGVTDPRTGAGGKDVLALHATIHIDNLSEFVSDPNHRARLGGRIDFPQFGMAIPSESGVFGLFSPSGDPALTYMVYELGFRCRGKPYYLAGKKHVRIAAPWTLWSATTTLYTTLHEGADSSALIIGAGVLRLGVPDLLRLLGTLHATNASSAARGAGAVWKFFKFFTAELVRTYLLRKPL